MATYSKEFKNKIISRMLPPNNESVSQEKQRKIDALNGIFGILTPEESVAVKESISSGIKCREVQL